ncbi:MAG TPA: hypothetical protein ENJ17_01080 [Gammaproteobacteria bacterium]|nr:hypothetical protein [Gammaproteobacteria bacterium]
MLDREQLIELRDDILNNPRSLPIVSGGVLLTDAQIAEVYNTVGISGETVRRRTLSGQEILDALDPAEFQTLSVEQQSSVLQMAGTGEIDVTNPIIKVAFRQLVPAGSTSETNVMALLNVSVSPARASGWGRVHHLDVANAVAFMSPTQRNSLGR